jgi:hypothetical protein
LVGGLAAYLACTATLFSTCPPQVSISAGRSLYRIGNFIAF